MLTLGFFDEEAKEAKSVMHQIYYSLSDKINFICKILKETFSKRINDLIIIMKYIKQENNFRNIKKNI